MPCPVAPAESDTLSGRARRGLDRALAVGGGLGGGGMHRVGACQDEQGRFSLNDLHQAAGGEQRHQPRYWLENKQTQALVAELENSGIPLVSGNSPDLASATPSNCADLHSFKTTEISRGFKAVAKIEEGRSQGGTGGRRSPAGRRRRVAPSASAYRQ